MAAFIIISIIILSFAYTLLDNSEEVARWDSMRRIIWRNGDDPTEIKKYETWKVKAYKTLTFDKD